MKIVVTEYVHLAALDYLKEEADLHYNAELYQDKAALQEALHSADALIVRNQTRVNQALLNHAPNLRVVGRVGVGLDNLELPVLKERGITVTWAPGTNAVSVAEYVMGAMLQLNRRFAGTSTKLHGGLWDRRTAIGQELFGKTLGIVGLGDIGSRLAKRAAAFGMRILASDPIVHQSSFAVQEYGVELLGLEQLLAQSDFVSLHAPLLSSTRHLLNAESLALMKTSAVLINTARGGLVQEADLAAALKNKTLAAAVLDVRQQEPPEDDPLRGLDNVILTPHIAGVTQESNRRASLHVASDVLRVLKGQRPLSLVT